MARTSKYAKPMEALPAAVVWRAGRYLRISKEDGDKEEGDKFESDSISNQGLVIDDHLVENELLDVNVIDTYSDDGFTGTNFDRPNFQRMIDDVRLGKINCIIVKDLSRFGRNYVEAGNYLEVFFRVMGVRFISVIDYIDSYLDPSSMNNISVSFKNVMNEEYCRDISNKIRIVFNAKRENGEYIGGFAPFGYMKDPNDKSKLLIDHDAAEIVRLIYKMFLEGYSIKQITRELNSAGIPNPTAYKLSKGIKTNHRGLKRDVLWGNGTVRYILTNRMLIGDMVQGQSEKISHKIDKKRQTKKEEWFIKEGTHEPIIEAATFWNVQDMLSRDKRVSPKTQMLDLFSGFLRCADCKRTLGKNGVSNPNLNYHYYVCRTHEFMSRTACPRHSIRSDRLENAVLAVISKQVSMAVEMSDLIVQINKSANKTVATSRLQIALDNYEKERMKSEKILFDLYPDYKDGLISKEQYIQFKAKHETDLEKTKRAIEELKRTFERDKDGINGTNDFLQTFIKFQGITKLTRELLIALVDYIEVHVNGGIDIKFKFEDAYQRAVDYIEVNKELLQEAM